MCRSMSNIHNHVLFYGVGQVGWGIAWYVNELLIPEIYIVRGVNYSFTVYGGDNTAQSAMYHPFYITNDTVGGYAQQSEDERKVGIT